MNVVQTPFGLKLGAFMKLTAAESGQLDQLHGRRKKFARGSDVIYQGQPKQAAYVLASGWACSYRLLSGGERQIFSFQIPGDFLGLRSVMAHNTDHNIEPVTHAEASEVLASELKETFRNSARFTAAVMWSASRDEAILMEHLVGIGRRNAKERTAHLLLELHARLKLVHMASASSFSCPLTQYLLGDALGLSAVHVNRVLRELREDGLATFQHGVVTFHNMKGLIALADFDSDYLDQYGALLN
jgi:CRP-like cAMP-binding protein